MRGSGRFLRLPGYGFAIICLTTLVTSCAEHGQFDTTNAQKSRVQGDCPKEVEDLKHAWAEGSPQYKAVAAAEFERMYSVGRCVSADTETAQLWHERADSYANIAAQFPSPDNSGLILGAILQGVSGLAQIKADHTAFMAQRQAQAQQAAILANQQAQQRQTNVGPVAQAYVPAPQRQPPLQTTAASAPSQNSPAHATAQPANTRPQPQPSDLAITQNYVGVCNNGSANAHYQLSNSSYYNANVSVQMNYRTGGIGYSFDATQSVAARSTADFQQQIPCGDSASLDDFGQSNITQWQFF